MSVNNLLLSFFNEDKIANQFDLHLQGWVMCKLVQEQHVILGNQNMKLVMNYIHSCNHHSEDDTKKNHE